MLPPLEPLRLLEENGLNPSDFLTDRHITGDFGDLCSKDKKANQEALVKGFRIFSSYFINDQEDKVWIITEARQKCDDPIVT